MEASDPMIVVDLYGFALQVNTAARSLYGHALIAGQHVNKILCSARGGHEIHRTAWGHQPVEVSATQVTWRGAHAEIHTIRPRITAVLEAQDVLIKEAVDASTTGLMVTDRSGTVLYANRAAHTITGYTPNELVGEHCTYKFSGAETSPQTASFLDKALFDAQPTQVTIRQHRKDESAFWAEVTLSPIRCADDTISHFVCAVNDVTELVQMHQQVIEGRDEEQKRLSRDLHDKSGQDFLSVMFFAQGMAARFRQRNKKQFPAAVEAATKFQEIADVLSEGLQGLRAVIRNTYQYKIHEQPITQSIAELLETLEMSTTAKLTLVTEDSLADLQLNDEATTHMYHIVAETVHNAVKYAEADAIEVSFTVSPEGDLLVAVEDNGKGYDPDTIPPGTGTKTRSFRARFLSGSVYIDSVKDRGTKVMCAFPNPQRFITSS
jgi:two-component system, NarL family, sensor histidine kinase NreB